MLADKDIRLRVWNQRIAHGQLPIFRIATALVRQEERMS
jgi:hypothetical protein